MGALLSKPVNKDEYDEWVMSWRPIRGEAAATMFGVAVGIIATHPAVFSLKRERDWIMVPFQKITSPWFASAMWFFGSFAAATMASSSPSDAPCTALLSSDKSCS